MTKQMTEQERELWSLKLRSSYIAGRLVASLSAGEAKILVKALEEINDGISRIEKQMADNANA